MSMSTDKPQMDLCEVLSWSSVTVPTGYLQCLRLKLHTKAKEESLPNEALSCKTLGALANYPA